jgi:hypothetical protein
MDHETFVFRRFKALSARNILNLHGELIKLEDDIAALEREAADGVDPELHLSMIVGSIRRELLQEWP